MALNDKERARLAAAARKMAEQLDVSEEERGDYVADYILALEDLDSKTSARLNVLADDVAAIAVALAPGDVAAIESFSSRIMETARATADKLGDSLTDIHHGPVRAAVAAAISDILGYFSDACEPESPSTAF
jgi:hypothetical protein